MTQTPLPFGHRLHAPSACDGSGPPYAYGSCGAPPDRAYSGTGSHHQFIFIFHSYNLQYLHTYICIIYNNNL